MVQLAWRHHYLQRNNIYTNQIGSKRFLLEGSVSYWIDTLINLIYIQVSGQGTGSGSGTNVRFRLKTLICLKCQVRTYPEDDHFWFCQIEKWIEVNSIKLCQVHIIWMIEKIALSGIFKFVFGGGWMWRKFKIFQIPYIEDRYILIQIWIFFIVILGNFPVGMLWIQACPNTNHSKFRCLKSGRQNYLPQIGNFPGGLGMTHAAWPQLTRVVSVRIEFGFSKNRWRFRIIVWHE